MGKLPLFVTFAVVLAAPTLAAAETGQQTFTDNCAACHQATGVGIPGAFPALKGSKVATGAPAGAIATVMNGRAAMPAFKDQLTDAQIAGVLTYVRAAWGNKAAAITPAAVAAVRGKK